MIRRRTDVQVVTSAWQMDGALEQGLRPVVLAELVAARACWHETGEIPDLTVSASAALVTAAADDWDAVFVRAARQQSGLQVSD